VKEVILELIKKTIRSRSPVHLGLLNRTTPVSKLFGLERGTPVDRFYIEKFLNDNSKYIRGVVLEIAEDTYSRRFNSDPASSFEVLSPIDDKRATIVGDLSKPESLPENKIDCFICTQTLNFIYNVKDAVRGAHRILKPGGFILITVGGISQISKYDMDRWGDYWRFTTASMKKLLEPEFEILDLKSNGNVLAATAFLQGMAVEDLPDSSLLKENDTQYQMVITCVAKKI
jgi:SAM-dependent methyltransferase